jgi:cell volume regulation protein A
VYGAATVLGGSGFLAVFVAGVAIGDVNAPYKREIERFHSAVGRLAETVVFVVLGLTVSLSDLVELDVVWPGLLIAVALTFLIRPVFVGLLLLPVDLRWGERLFVLWSGLKGAVPLLLGTFAFTSGLDGARRIYEIVFVVVAFSVIVQGSLVPTVARWGKVPMKETEPEPWALGMRFQRRPDAVQRFEVESGSLADGCAIGDLALGEGLWISLVNRGGTRCRSTATPFSQLATRCSRSAASTADRSGRSRRGSRPSRPPRAVPCPAVSSARRPAPLRCRSTAERDGGGGHDPAPTATTP